jgi:ribosomal protein S18 acetylase RimI-like enzyme
LSLQLRALTLNDCEPWAELLAVAFDRTPHDMQQLLRWLQAEHDLIAWGAWEDTRLVAQYSSLLTAVWLPSTASFECVGLSINLAVHPAYRGRGLVKHVAQPVYTTLIDRGVLAGVGFSNAAGVKVDRRSQAYGYQVIGRMQSVLIGLFPWLKSEPLRLTPDWPSAPFEFAPSTDELIRFAASPILIRHRFVQHPFRRYHFGVWETSAGVRGIVVYRLVKWKGLRVASLLAAYGHDVAELVQHWAAALRHAGIYFVQALTTPTAVLRAALHNIGWGVRLPYTRSPYFLTVKPLTETASAMLNFTRWDCSGGDIL